ncbi:host specificity protein [Bradyrhizobium sp. CCGUVB4N]|uniref:host specificity protein n=1 Tax=Bradyrhizobium sp. CCGUVB4N TaxID=2949631 RepID=UPI0020B2D09C|nr:host specificity protein [Bradyrhizobium sp. CCGUVB4N]MCP3380137.1 host specificity protein [Bradyrhizobium sp. CCGUVB4N]
MHSHGISASQSAGASRTDESGESGDSQRFERTLAGMEPGSSSSANPRPYSLVSAPPIEQIARSTFDREVREFFGDEIKYIADNPQEYTDFVSTKAERAAMVARVYASTADNAVTEPRFFRYRLGDTTVGLLRAGGPMIVRGDRLQRQFGRNEFTSVVDLRLSHPLVENAGDILLEHQLRQDGDQPSVMSRPAIEGMEPRLAEMGFVDMGRNHWVLDPTQHPEKWTKNADNEWQRSDKPALYLSKAEGDDSDTEAGVEANPSEASVETDSTGDDPSWYLERALTFS